jgi:hypothetical protein
MLMIHAAFGCWFQKLRNDQWSPFIASCSCLLTFSTPSHSEPEPFHTTKNLRELTWVDCFRMFTPFLPPSAGMFSGWAQVAPLWRWGFFIGLVIAGSVSLKRWPCGCLNSGNSQCTNGLWVPEFWARLSFYSLDSLGSSEQVQYLVVIQCSIIA